MAEVKKVWKRWQVLTGKHTLNNGGTFKKGEKFITDANMNVFNTDPGNLKYKELGEVSEREALEWTASEGAKSTAGTTNLPVTQEEVDDTAKNSLEAMTIAQLRELAEEEEIDLTGAHRHADIVAKIQEARDAANAEDE